MNKSNMLKGYLFVIASGFIFGCMPLMANFIYRDGVNSLSLVFLRNAFSIPMLGIIAKAQKQSLRIPRKALVSISLVGIMGCCLTPLLLFSSYNYMSSGSATVFHFIYPALAVIGGIVFLKEKARVGNLICVLICVAGICMFYNPGDPLDWRGSTLALLSGVAYAVYILLLAVFPYRDISGFRFSFFISLTSTLLLLVVCLVSGQLTFPKTLTGWLFCLLFAFTINVGAVVLFQQGTLLIGGQRAAILSTVEPITSIFAGALFLNEVIGLRTAIGSVLVILSSVLIAVFDMLRARKEVQ